MHDFPNKGNIPGNMTSSNLHCIPIEMTIHNSYENKLGESIEDCRDFLRTGRCKYGASCKFYHPSNVESGGGMKIPIDPSEPMFPIRPNEPVCQYYMKHGTCKFGQACKFHHPPLNTLQQTPSILSSTSVFLPRTCEQRIVLNSLGQDQGISAMMVQFLPQRPDEPDCTYYLRNGTCKYGATCRYHHPVSYHQQGKMESQRRPQTKLMQVQSQLSSEGVMQFVQSQAVYQHQNNRVISSPGVQHVLVTETPLKVMSISNGSVQSGASDDISRLPVNIPIGMSQHHASSSSIASSFETASCGLEFIPESWDKSKRSNSSGSFTMYVDAQQARQGSVPGANRLLGSTNDMSMQNRRLRAASFGSLGSTSENSGYYDGYLGWPPANGLHGLRANHESSYEAGQQVDQSFRQSSYGIRDDLQQRRAHQDQRGTIAYHGLPHQNRVNNVDQGLSMMTSALLNMLDTPEDAAARSYPQCDPSTTAIDSLSPNASIGNRNNRSQYFSSTSTNHGHNQESIRNNDSVLLQGNSGSLTLSSHRYRDIPPAIDTITGASAPAKYQGTTTDFVYDATRYQDNDFSPVSRDWSNDWQEIEGQQMRPNLLTNPLSQHRKQNDRANHLPHLGTSLPYFP